MPLKTLLSKNETETYFFDGASEYLFKEKTHDDGFVISKNAIEIYKGFNKYLKSKKATTKLRDSLSELKDNPLQQFQLALHWVNAFHQHSKKDDKTGIYEATLLVLLDGFDSKDLSVIEQENQMDIEEMKGEHRILNKQNYQFNYHAFLKKLRRYSEENVVQYQTFIRLKKSLSIKAKEDLRLEEYKPRVLSSFVRNKLIDAVYLPLIGDNLAKQIGTAGENTRTDRMGLLLLISPPGYGKTTLMEYVANRLGLIFMKINGPALGHHVISLDPEDAPNRAAAQELEKLNLSFEMGDNVMIYLDDIQHCNAEFLQKFISLCDAQRKVEGVWKGRVKTYDFRGKRVCVVMAGNPYTESGEIFQIPDMLANRADIYNLGDILGNSAKEFKMSYLENCITSNSSLSRLGNKNTEDIYSLIRIAETNDQSNINLKSNHSPEELNEYVSVLKKLIKIRDVVLKVNQEYIRSSGINDEYRTEPPFKLQGSYRDMNKMAEKVVPIMNEKELQTLIISHYQGEAQTLTTGTEANLLKFKELIGELTKEEMDRWNEIKRTYTKNKSFQGMDKDNPIANVVVQMSRFSDGVEGIKQVLQDLGKDQEK